MNIHLNERLDSTARRTGNDKLQGLTDSRLGCARRRDPYDPHKAAALVQLVADELVKGEAPSLPIHDRERIVDWMIRDPYVHSRITTYLERALSK
jgi:hypothetical protein